MWMTDLQVKQPVLVLGRYALRLFSGVTRGMASASTDLRMSWMTQSGVRWRTLIKAAAGAGLCQRSMDILMLKYQQVHESDKLCSIAYGSKSRRSIKSACLRWYLLGIVCGNIASMLFAARNTDACHVTPSSLIELHLYDSSLSSIDDL